MDEMTCPRCGSAMAGHRRGGVSLSQCTSCEGIFLERSDLGDLVESENDWHQHSGPKTAPLPRISAEMTAPPPPPPQARSYLETLFGGS